ncbi:unnamed protein product [Amoebophrya sp. A120]|nr:unnamed protein product [Amoebophrya sp. A120]|eukprot:GSA120T00008295001.1
MSWVVLAPVWWVFRKMDEVVDEYTDHSGSEEIDMNAPIRLARQEEEEDENARKCFSRCGRFISLRMMIRLTLFLLLTVLGALFYLFLYSSGHNVQTSCANEGTGWPWCYLLQQKSSTESWSGTKREDAQEAGTSSGDHGTVGGQQWVGERAHVDRDPQYDFVPEGTEMDHKKSPVLTGNGDHMKHLPKRESDRQAPPATIKNGEDGGSSLPRPPKIAQDAATAGATSAGGDKNKQHGKMAPNFLDENASSRTGRPSNRGGFGELLKNAAPDDETPAGEKATPAQEPGSDLQLGIPNTEDPGEGKHQKPHDQNVLETHENHGETTSEERPQMSQGSQGLQRAGATSSAPGRSEFSSGFLEIVRRHTACLFPAGSSSSSESVDPTTATHEEKEKEAEEAPASTPRAMTYEEGVQMLQELIVEEVGKADHKAEKKETKEKMGDLFPKTIQFLRMEDTKKIFLLWGQYKAELHDQPAEAAKMERREGDSTWDIVQRALQGGGENAADGLRRQGQFLALSGTIATTFVDSVSKSHEEHLDQLEGITAVLKSKDGQILAFGDRGLLTWYENAQRQHAGKYRIVKGDDPAEPDGEDVRSLAKLVPLTLITGYSTYMTMVIAAAAPPAELGEIGRGHVDLRKVADMIMSEHVLERTCLAGAESEAKNLLSLEPGSQNVPSWKQELGQFLRAVEPDAHVEKKAELQMPHRAALPPNVVGSSPSSSSAAAASSAGDSLRPHETPIPDADGLSLSEPWRTAEPVAPGAPGSGLPAAVAPLPSFVAGAAGRRPAGRATPGAGGPAGPPQESQRLLLQQRGQEPSPSHIPTNRAIGGINSRNEAQGGRETQGVAPGELGSAGANGRKAGGGCCDSFLEHKPAVSKEGQDTKKKLQQGRDPDGDDEFLEHMDDPDDERLDQNQDFRELERNTTEEPSAFASSFLAAGLCPSSPVEEPEPPAPPTPRQPRPVVVVIRAVADKYDDELEQVAKTELDDDFLTAVQVLGWNTAQLLDSVCRRKLLQLTHDRQGNLLKPEDGETTLEAYFPTLFEFLRHEDTRSIFRLTGQLFAEAERGGEADAAAAAMRRNAGKEAQGHEEVDGMKFQNTLQKVFEKLDPLSPNMRQDDCESQVWPLFLEKDMRGKGNGAYQTNWIGRLCVAATTFAAKLQEAPSMEDSVAGIGDFLRSSDGRILFRSYGLPYFNDKCGKDLGEETNGGASDYVDCPLRELGVRNSRVMVLYTMAQMIIRVLIRLQVQKHAEIVEECNHDRDLARQLATESFYRAFTAATTPSLGSEEPVRRQLRWLLAARNDALKQKDAQSKNEDQTAGTTPTTPFRVEDGYLGQLLGF